MLVGVFETADWTTALIERIAGLMHDTETRVRASLPDIPVRELAAIGLLEQRSVGRERLYLNTALLDALVAPP